MGQLHTGSQGEALQLGNPQGPALCTHTQLLPVNGVPSYSIYQQMCGAFGPVYPLSSNSILRESIYLDERNISGEEGCWGQGRRWSSL